MLEKEFCLLNSAYESYNLDKRESISKEVLKYIRTRIVENKELIEKISESSNESVTFEEILQVFDEEVNKKEKYKSEKKLTKLDNNYAYGVYTTSIGNIVIECSDTLTILKYYINAIKSRNTITISDSEYNDVSLKSALLIIFCEALSKFNIDMNLIMLIPYEECYYEKYDKLIYADEKKASIQKETTDKLYIYVEDESFKEYVEKEKLALKFYGKEYEILTGDFYDAVHKINEKFSNGASIYTKNSAYAFKFINLVHSRNVFVNSSLVEMEVVQDVVDELYMKKKIMYPLTNANNDLNSELKSEKNIVNENEEKIEISKDKVINNEKLNNMQMIKKDTNPWYIRIFECIKRFFKKF